MNLSQDILLILLFSMFFPQGENSFVTNTNFLLLIILILSLFNSSSSSTCGCSTCSGTTTNSLLSSLL